MGGGELGDEPSCSVGGRLHHVLICAVSGGAWWRSWPCLHAASESNPHGTIVQIDARGAVVRAATYGELLEDDQWW